VNERCRSSLQRKVSTGTTSTSASRTRLWMSRPSTLDRAWNVKLWSSTIVRWTLWQYRTCRPTPLCSYRYESWRSTSSDLQVTRCAFSRLKEVSQSVTVWFATALMIFAEHKFRFQNIETKCPGSSLNFAALYG